MIDEARRRGIDGVVCGHIYEAEMRRFDDIIYCNDGDWIESCTALVEHPDGQLEMLDWAEIRSLFVLPAARDSALPPPGLTAR